MDSQTFEDCLAHADLMLDLYGRQNYWLGYRRGLRRAFYGDAFCTEEEHQLWLSLVDRPQWEVAERGRGYHDGLRVTGVEDQQKRSDNGDSKPLRIVLERSNSCRD
jgi:hypothetical protein